MALIYFLESDKKIDNTLISVQKNKKLQPGGS